MYLVGTFLKSPFVCLSTVITYVTLVSPQVLYLERAKNRDVSETTKQSTDWATRSNDYLII